jgi:hypothetical protein
MPDQPSHHHNLWLLKEEIFCLECQIDLLAALPANRRQSYAGQAQARAAKLKLLRLYGRCQHLWAELQG